MYTDHNSLLFFFNLPSGHKYSFQLLLYETRKQHLKNCIRLEEVVMLRSNMDCHFQLYLPDSKILQLRADSTEKQAQWMALIKVGLGRGGSVHADLLTWHSGRERGGRVR